MKTPTKTPAVQWKKGETVPCRSGKCSHRHVAKTGPCIEVGCPCHGTKDKKVKS